MEELSSIKCFGGVEGRKKAFKPGGIVAKRFACSRNAVMKIGSFLFVHGGMNEKHMKKNIKQINGTMRDFLNGDNKFLCSLSEQINNFKWYYKIANYKEI